MKRNRIDQTPRFLDDVIDAIKDLSEIGGSKSNNIVNYVKRNINTRGYPVTRNITTQIRRALKHAITNGLIRQRAGKFRINMAKRKKRPDPCTDCSKCKKAKKKAAAAAKKRGRNRRFPVRKRRPHGKNMGYYTESGSDCSSSDLPTRKVAKKPCPAAKKRAKPPKRKVVTRKPPAKHVKKVPKKDKRDVDNESGQDNNSCDEQTKTGREAAYPDDHNSDDDEEQQNNTCSCDNPDCLCNVKQEVNDDDDEDLNEYNKT